MTGDPTTRSQGAEERCQGAFPSRQAVAVQGELPFAEGIRQEVMGKCTTLSRPLIIRGDKTESLLASEQLCPL